MRPSEPPASAASEAAARPPGALRLGIALWLALLAAAVPLLRVVESGAWLPGAALLAAVLLAVGWLLRRRRVPAGWVTLIELAVWTVAVTAVFLHDDAFLGVIPTGGVLDAVPLLVETASNEIVAGVAPLDATPALSFIIVAALGLLTIALDHVVLTARMPLLASVALAAVWLIPSLAVAGTVDVGAFVVLAAAVLYLIRAETRTREAPASQGRPGGVTAVAVTIGAVAIVGALVAGPVLPPPGAAAGSGGTATIDASLDLGDDLRARSNDVVLTMRSDAPQLPYLRVATLSAFDGEVWTSDRMRSLALEDGALPAVEADDGVRVLEYTTDVEVAGLSSASLPVPYPVVSVTGLSGQWRAVPYNRTVVTSDSSSRGQRYEAVAHVPRPTLEQIRAAVAVAPATNTAYLTSLPDDVPATIGEIARDVTTNARTDYDKLIALQSWFRGPEFTYSLDTPVDDGFDDSGAAAAAVFLERKSGYCVHFAGAFALMARTLGMPARIAVGFLPGDYTGDSVDGERVAAVTLSQLHAWPEVYFGGVGWVPFEPTKSLGNPTLFMPAATQTDDAGVDVTAPTPTPTPTTSSTAGPMERPDDAGAATGAVAQATDLRPLLTVLLVALLLAAAPAVAAWVRRRVLARRHTVAAAWRLVQDAALDLGAAVPASESPRAFGARLVTRYGAPSDAVARLVGAIERTSYARPGAEESGGAAGARATADALEVRHRMLDAAPTPGRVPATLLPRSLVLRPGSPVADRDAAFAPGAAAPSPGR